jgi:hypothetical protein
MKFELQDLNIPLGCKIVKNDFTTYNPDTDFSEERNFFYLTEDLLQIEFVSQNLIIDLGWYGDLSTNQGIFKIYIIENMDWDNPLRIEESKSQMGITIKFNLILEEIK